ncbi:MAG TPA: MFS transporter [Micropepsaceae bacterium]|jgi:MFS family permease|nr:MFS transporter [Micropepsaceae bacterium]
MMFGLRLRPPTVVLSLLCAMYFLMFINRTNMAIAGPSMQADLHLSNTDLGLAFSAFAYPYAAFQLFGGMLGDRFGPRATLTISAFIVFLATLWIGFAGGLASLFIARILLGIGEGAAFPTATRAMSSWTPAGRWAFAQGITHTFSRVGNWATALIVAPLILWLSWRASFYLLAPVTLVWMALWFWYFRDRPSEHRGMTPTEVAKLPVRARGDHKRKIPWLRLAWFILPVTCVDFCYGWTLWLFQNWIPSFFVQNYGLNLNRTAIFTAGVLFAGIVGDTLGGIISDAILKRTGNLVAARRSVIMAGFIGSFIFMIPVIMFHDLTIAAVSLSLVFFFSELIVAPIWAVPMDIAPRYAGTASGMMNFGFGFAGIVSPIFFGTMIDWTGTWTVPFLVSIGLLLLGAVLAFYLRPDRPFTDDDAPPAPAVAMRQASAA